MIGVLFAIIFVLLGWFYFDSKKKQEYWKSRGVPFIKPIPFFGNAFKMFFMSESQDGLIRQAYKKYRDKKYIGIYEGNQPVLIPIDTELIGKIMVKDFSHFVDHGIMDNEPETEIDEILFSLKGSHWRALRYKLVPAFSTGKMRNMYPEMLKCTDSWISKLETMQGGDIEMLQMCRQFSMAVIASCAFGVELPIEPDSTFMKMGTAINNMDFKRYFQLIIHYFLPRVARIFGITQTPKCVAEYFAGLIKETLNFRMKNNMARNDFVQLLLELKQKGSLEVSQSKDSDDQYLQMDAPPPTETIEITERVLISQAFSFIQAGFDGFSILIMWVLYELTVHRDIQDKVRKELQSAVQKYGGLTYEVLKETVYFNNCIKEGLRKYPLVPTLYRECTKRHYIDDGVSIEPGTKIYIPLLALHKDPQYYPDPQRYNPDRFLKEPTPFTNMPFGDGPRMCIALRFAQLVIKQACAAVLLNFNMELSPNTKLPLKMNKKSFFPKATTPVLFRLKKIS